MAPPKRPDEIFIGNRLVATAKPKDRPYEIRDSRLPGFLLRVQPSGTLIYVCEYGRGKRITIGPTSKLTPTQARDKAREILAAVELGSDPQAERKAALTQAERVREAHYDEDVWTDEVLTIVGLMSEAGSTITIAGILERMDIARAQQNAGTQRRLAAILKVNGYEESRKWTEGKKRNLRIWKKALHAQ